MTDAYLCFLVIRVMIVVLSVEICARYGAWWWQVRRHNPDEMLGPLLKGVWIYHGCIGAMLAYFGIHSTNYSGTFGGMATPIVLAFGACYGSIVHLIPCWRITNAASARSIAMSLAFRAIITGLVSFAFVRLRGF